MAATALQLDLDPPTVARDLVAFIHASPTPYHAVAEVGRRLDAAGFAAVAAADDWATVPARGYLAAGGAVVAWSVPDGCGPSTPFQIIGAHTDSPNLRIRPQPDTGRAGWRQLGVEVYGGALVNSWLDRDLGLAGRVAVRSTTATSPEMRLMRVDRPILRVPQLAIHLDRDISEKGLHLNRQIHLSPVWGLGSAETGAFRAFLAVEIGVDSGDVLAWDVMVHDLAPGTLAGVADEFVSAGRLDNLCSCFVAATALTASPVAEDARAIGVISLFDHEEVGSTSAVGADGALLSTVLERLVLARGGGREDFLRARAGSMCASADMAHATHPNYAERHEPDHPITVNAGPVVKINTNQRYATDGLTQARFEQACADAEVPVQRFVSRGDMACGSTIGPLTAARLGIPTVDVGIAQLAMHSARELCGSADPALYVRALTAWLAVRSG